MPNLRSSVLAGCIAALAMVPIVTRAQVTATQKTPPRAVAAKGYYADLTLAKDSTQIVLQVDGQGQYWDATLYTTDWEYLTSLSLYSTLAFDFQYVDSPKLKVARDGSVKSTYSVAGLDIALEQRLKAGPLTDSYLLIQTYELTNPGVESVKVLASRFQDSDLLSSTGERTDGGYIPPAGRSTYLLSELAPGRRLVTDYIGIRLSGGTQGRRTVRACCNFDEIPRSENRWVVDDLDSDGVGDLAGDHAITQQRRITVNPGETVTVTSRTLFGHTVLRSRDDLPTD